MSDANSKPDAALAAVLDEIIPPKRDAGLPGAGEIGLGEAILAETPDLQSVVEQGLATLASLVASRGPDGFSSLPDADRLELMNELATREPAFLPGLIFQTYVRYYQHPTVVEALGMEARPPHPLGYELEVGDLGLLDEVRTRTGLYRDV